jgi:hypothetical protein
LIRRASTLGLRAPFAPDNVASYATAAALTASVAGVERGLT